MKTENSSGNCPYCPPKDPEHRILFQEELVFFLQDERYQGSLKHSGVIVPWKHRETAFDLTEEEWMATFRLLAVVRQWMEETVAPDGYNLGWNCGTVGGQSVAHAHFHVIPRFREEPLAGEGIRTLLKSEANRW